MAAPVAKSVECVLIGLKKFMFWAGREEEGALRDSKAIENREQEIST
jgi:hypothetical protein